MIILPDRHIPRAKFLMPVVAGEWRTPSQAQQKDCFGNENNTTFHVIARCNRQIVWHGRFEDREDFDAFLWALATGFLKYDRPLWRLPTPNWFPDLGEGLTYQFVTTAILTSTSSSAQNYTVPLDWGSISNTIDCLGAGSGGAAAAVTGTPAAGGGAGGAWAQISNTSLPRGGTRAFFVNVGGATVTGVSTIATGSVGTNCWFRIDTGSTTPISSAQGVLAEGGGIGGAALSAASGTVAGAIGGRTGSCIGAVIFAGGGGGAAIGSTGPASGGGGGAAGMYGTGQQGGSPTDSWGGGGIGDNANGGAGGGAPGATGSDGAEMAPSYGSGGGGASNYGSASSTGGSGGFYGAGGGGSSVSVTPGTASSGAGRQGGIRIIYTPFVPAAGFNIPMLGF